MATAKDWVCCKEIREATDKIGSNICITTHPSFEWVCLDTDILRTVPIAMSDVHFDCYLEPIQPRTYRLAACRPNTL